MKSPPNNLILGRFGEEKATQHLQKQGYKILEVNYRKKHGDIDIIAGKGGILVFIEVKTRTSGDFGLPEEQIGKRDIKRLEKAVQLYLYHKKLDDVEVRIDFIGIMMSPVTGKADINHIENISS